MTHGSTAAPSNGQLIANYLRALALSDQDPEALIAARYFGAALNRRRKVRSAAEESRSGSATGDPPAFRE